VSAGVLRMDVTETLLFDASWDAAADDCFLQSGQGEEFILLAEELEFDEDMALPGVKIADSYTSRTSTQTHSAAIPPKPAAPQSNISKEKNGRLERLRSRNRAAQAKFRQKAKARAPFP
jgi:hypothetical protein